MTWFWLHLVSAACWFILASSLLPYTPWVPYVAFFIVGMDQVDAAIKRRRASLSSQDEGAR